MGGRPYLTVTLVFTWSPPAFTLAVTLAVPEEASGFDTCCAGGLGEGTCKVESTGVADDWLVFVERPTNVIALARVIATANPANNFMFIGTF